MTWLIVTENLCHTHHHDLVNSYGESVSQMTTNMFRFSLSLSGPFLIHDLSPGL